MSLEFPPPAVGRIVHYRSYGTPVKEDGTQEYPAVDRAAIITGIYATIPEDPEVYADLAVLNPEGMFFNRKVKHDRTGEVPGQWHWPVYKRS